MTTKQSEQSTPTAGDIEAKDMALYLADLLDDRQAHDIVMLHVGPLVGYTDWFVVASAKSDRQVKALANHVERTGRSDGLRPLGSEGTERGHWALVDYGDVIVHIFRDEERYFYDLESLWAEATKLPYPPEGHVRPERPARPEGFDGPFIDDLNDEDLNDEDLDDEDLDGAYGDEDLDDEGDEDEGDEDEGDEDGDEDDLDEDDAHR